MKALIVSDLHSNIQALEAIWQVENDSDVIYCAGDLVDIGPSPNEIIEWMIDHNANCIAGNHDDHLIDLIDNHPYMTYKEDSKRTWLQHNAEVIKKENLEYLRNLPKYLEFEIENQKYYMTHKYIDYEIISSKFQFEKFLDNINKPYSTRLIFGHTHQQNKTWFAEDELMLNPGSISYRTYREPEDLSRKAEYITITNGKIELKGIHYNTSDLFKIILANQEKINKNNFDKAKKRFG